MTPIVIAFFSTIGALAAALVAYLLGRRKATAEAGNVAVDTADQLVVLLRADMLAVRAEMVADREASRKRIAALVADVTELHRVALVTEGESRACHEQLARIQALNVDLTARVVHLEAQLRQQESDSLKARVDLLERPIAPHAPTPVEVVNAAPLPVSIAEPKEGK